MIEQPDVGQGGFCSTSCANRTNMAAYRARQAHLSG